MRTSVKVHFVHTWVGHFAGGWTSHPPLEVPAAQVRISSIEDDR
jgi:hypothetical protein